MPILYPPVQPTLSGDIVSISRFLNSPTLIQRRLRTIAEQMFISDRLLTGRFTTQSGSVLYETSEDIFADDAPEAVAPGAEYPLTSISTGQANMAYTTKWGRDVEVTDESISRQLMNPVQKAFTKLVNSMVNMVDGITLSAIDTAVTQTTATIGEWSGSTSNIFRDVQLAAGKIRDLKQGYDPDLVVISSEAFAYLSSDTNLMAALRREDKSNAVYTGNFPRIAGLTILHSPNVADSTDALVLDSTQLGGMVDENLQGPGYAGGGFAGIQAKSIREDKTDSWLLRCRRVCVPIVQEPACAWKITGILS